MTAPKTRRLSNVKIGDSTSNENNEKSEIEALKNQVAELMKIVKSGEVKPIAHKSKKQEVETTDIAPNEYIKVISLCSNVLNLSTKPYGRGKVFSFKKFGDSKKMLYSELLDVIETSPHFLEAGYFFIMDYRVINSLNYTEMYEKILTKEQMERIFENSEDALKLFETANEKQQENIVKFFIDKIYEGQKVDFNLISNISRISNIESFLHSIT